MKKKTTTYKIIETIIYAIIAKGIAFIKSLILAFFYGASRITDVFNISQNIPSSIFTLLGTSLTSGFIPTYMEIEKKDGKNKADEFFNNLINILLILSFIIVIVGVTFSKILTFIFGSGFDEETFNICNAFVKIIMPSLIAMIIAHMCNAYLQINNCFKQNSIMNIPFNIIQIIFIIISVYFKNFYLLALGLLLASYSQLIYMLILLKLKINFKFKYEVNLKDRKIKNIFILIFPVFISTGANQINTMIDKSLASGLIEGSVSALNYASEIITMVTQIIVLNITTVIFPKMTKISLERNLQKNRNDYYSKMFSLIAIIIFPLTIFIFSYSNEIIDILFGRGAFDKKTVIFVGNALKVYSIGIIGFSYRDVLNKLFYSTKDTKTPMIVGIVSVIINIVLNYVLINNYKYLGLAFATSVSGIFCTILLFIIFLKTNKIINSSDFLFNFIKIIISCIIVGLEILALNRLLLINNIYLKMIIHIIILSISYLFVLFKLKEMYIIEYLSIIINRYFIKGKKRGLK